MKPLIYIASPYTKGNQALNVRHQINRFDWVHDIGGIPFAPLLGHFVAVVYPHISYKEWLEMDLQYILRCDAVYASNVRVGKYEQKESVGRDTEIKHAENHGIPVFWQPQELQKWIYDWGKLKGNWEFRTLEGVEKI